jgi:hypothetical protein
VSAPLWVTELAEAFWADAGGPGPFPRDLRRPARRALPLSVEALPRLGVRRVADWLRGLGVPCPFGGPDRPLRGCLLALGDNGLVFLDADDPQDEQRFSLAHEVAHFLRDYGQPRRRAVAVLGPPVLEVLDGRRPPTPAERLHGALRGVPVGVHRHLLARAERGAPVSSVVAASEQDADRLAFELLAPAAELRGVTDVSALRHRLVAEFGLPAAEASRYVEVLLPPARRCPFLERLRRACP